MYILLVNMKSIKIKNHVVNDDEVLKNKIHFINDDNYSLYQMDTRIETLGTTYGAAAQHHQLGSYIIVSNNCDLCHYPWCCH